MGKVTASKLKLSRAKWAKYVRVGKMEDFGKVKTYQSNNALKKPQKPADLWDFI